MVKKIIFFPLLLAITLSIHAQENPKIDKKEFFPLTDKRSKVRKAVSDGNSYYLDALYDAALQQYMKMYSLKDDYSPLNYKIAVSHLYGIHPKNALAYFNRTSPNVASDFYCQKGIALIYHQQYDEAKLAFRQYMESLTPTQAFEMSDKISRFMAICDFSANAVKDSLPVFVINAGPKVNSYYDDYSAVELTYPVPSLYFTSRRPTNSDMNIATYSVFPERILWSPEYKDGKASDAEDSWLSSNKHLSVAGVDNNTGTLFYYKGKKRFGDIYSTRFKENGKPVNKDRLSKTINNKTSTEGSVSITDNGDIYFISNRIGGVGGKDIWFAKYRGKNKYDRPQNVRNLNTPLNEECVYVTPDGNTLYFSSNGLPGMGGFDIYKSVKTSYGSWSDPVNMGYPINGPDDDLFYRPTSDTIISLLSSRRSGGFGGLDIYFVKKDLRIPFELFGNVTDVKTGQTLHATVKLLDKETGLPVATSINDTIEQRYAMNLIDIGDYYLHVEAPGYRSMADTFTNPVTRHAKVQHDFALVKLLSPFTLNGYITDVRTGKPVLAEVILRSSENAVYRTVTDEKSGYFVITMEDKENADLTVRATDYYDHKENLQLKSIAGNSDSKNITLQRSIIIYTVTGVVNSEGNMEPLKANINVGKAGNEQLIQKVVTDDNGKYELTLTDVGPFLMEVSSEGHFFVNSVLQFNEDSTLVIRNFALKKMESGAKMVIDNILFNTGASTLLPESYNSLNKLVNLLRENPKVRIEVSGHTDNIGSATTNKTLSRNRALSVRNYLISQGIAGERVNYDGYGFERPIAPNDTPDGRAANRRVEIEILD